MQVVTVAAEDTRPLRQRVLRAGDLADVPLHESGPESQHLAVLLEADVVGCCWVAPTPAPWHDPGPGWHLGGMAVDPARQGDGVGRLLLGEAASRARAGGADLLWCHARATARGFYASCGWVERGDTYMRGRLEHVLMWTPL